MLKKIIVQLTTTQSLGRQIGHMLQKQIKRRLRALGIPSMLNARRNCLERLESMCRTTYANQLDEIRGLAQGSGCNYWELLLLNAPELRNGKEGCSSIAICEPGLAKVFHNEDGGIMDRTDDCAVVTVQRDGVSHNAFVYPGELPGAAFCWNSAGFFHSVNWVSSDSRNDCAHPSRIFTSNKLFWSRTLSEGLTILQTVDDASGYHYFLGQSSRIYSVETHCATASVQEVTGIKAHTNHYVHKTFKRAEVSGDSAARLAQIEEALRRREPPLSIMFNDVDPTFPIFSPHGPINTTLATVSVDLVSRSLTIFEPSGESELFQL